MSSKTKIVVLHMKELIYTGIFAALGILLIILLVVMLLPQNSDSSSGEEADPGRQTNTQQSSEEAQPTSQIGQSSSQHLKDTVATSSSGTYIPGVYTTELVLNDQSIDVEVIVNQSSITSIRLVNLSEAVTTMYPLLQPTFDSLCNQIYEKQSLDEISYETESKYTSLVLLEAIRHSLEKAIPSISEAAH